MIFLDINYYLVKKNQYILVIKFEYFLFSLYRALSLKGNHILVQKWPRPSSRLKLFSGLKNQSPECTEKGMNICRF